MSTQPPSPDPSALAPFGPRRSDTRPSGTRPSGGGSPAGGPSAATASAARAPRVGIVGATGAVGGELLLCLEQRRFPLSCLRLFASPRSAGRSLLFRQEPVKVEALTEAALAELDIVLFSAGSATSRQFAPVAVRHGAVVVDNSSAFRMEPDVPLVVPEVNAADIGTHRGVIANPNCVAIVASVPLWPLHRVNPIRRVIAATYQAASGAGAAAMEELRESTEAYLEGRDYPARVLAHPYAFNLFSHDTQVDPATGYNDEETKVIREMRKIMGEPELRIGVTCIRVPVLRAHSIALTVEFADPITPDAVRARLATAPGVRLVDDVAHNHFPMPREASGQDEILVGRIRQDVSDPSGRSIALFVAGDQLLKGAALNAVQIAEKLVV
ncbi:MAG: aspartate-semialdehyde dehydrogenase [Rhodospirillales bacterium]|nr:aspartate-semialdehyde dehydrogenase [Rhodospirillales bacterium]